MRMEGGTGTRYHKKGLWTEEEDKILTDYVKLHGKGQWNRIAKKTGLKRCGKSCRLRWMNYLSPTVNRGSFTEEEEDLIIRLHKLIGNRWSLIAKRVPGRTDNQVKNYWNTHLSKKLGIKKHNNINIKPRNALPSPAQKDSTGSDDKVSETSTNSVSSSVSHVITSEPAEAAPVEEEEERGVSHEHEEAVVDASSEPQNMSASRGYEHSFCDFDDGFELSGISTMDFLNQYAAEFDWQCL